MKVYHVDLDDNFSKYNTKIIELMEIPKTWGNYDILSQRYPDGISKWGYSVLNLQNNFPTKSIDLSYKNNENIFIWNSYFIDILFEYERLASYPEKLSRFQSFFASKDLESAYRWRSFLGCPEAKIYEMEFNHDNYEELDADFLDSLIGSFSLPSVQNNAFRYWNGYTHKEKNPNLELMIKPPINVLRAIP